MFARSRGAGPSPAGPTRRTAVRLNAPPNRPFDRGLFTFDPALRVVVSARWRGSTPPPPARPDRFEPDPESVRFQPN